MHQNPKYTELQEFLFLTPSLPLYLQYAQIYYPLRTLVDTLPLIRQLYSHCQAQQCHIAITIVSCLDILKINLELVFQAVSLYLKRRTLFYENSIVHIVYVILLARKLAEILLNLILR